MKTKNVSLKRVLSILTAVIMLIGVIPCATAAEVVVRELQADVLGGTLTVTGVLSNAEKANHVLALVSAAGKDVSELSTEEDYKKVVAMGYGATTSTDTESFSITVEMPDKLSSGTYRVTVGNSVAVNNPYAEFYYLGHADRETLLTAVNNEEITAEEFVAVLNKIPVAFDASGASTAIFKTLGKNAKLKLAELILAARDSEEGEIDIVAFGEISKEALLVASFAAADADKGYEAAFAAVKYYNELAGLDLNNAFFTRLSDAENFVKAINAQGEVTKAEDISAAMDSALVLARLNETSYLAMPQFIKDNNDFFGVDEDEYKEVTSVKKLKEYLCSALRSNTPVYTKADFATAWTASVEKAKEDYAKYKKNQGGGGSSSKDDKKDNVLTTTTINQGLLRNDPLDKKTTIDEYYDDLAGYEWAFGAILDLTQNNIINGTGNKKFEPARSLKREEFMKLLVNVFNLADLKATCSFSDVTDKDAWYYVYIASAQQAGITTGRGDGTFGIGDVVTREEMATLIYRAAQKAGITLSRLPQSATVYSDENAISPYALEAVGVLSDNQVIGAASEGVFLPQTGASRAQAASAIYNIKKYIK